MKVYLMDIARFKEMSFVDTNVDDKTVKLSMGLAQDQIIEPVLGSKLFDKITDGIYAGNLELAYQNLLVKYIWPALVSATEVIAYKKILYRVTNSSIVKDSNANSTAIDIGELQGLIRDNEVFMEQYINKLQLCLNANSGEFPEYYQADPDDLVAQSGQNGVSFYYDGPDITTLGPSSRP
jgi:hypothetical protein